MTSTQPMQNCTRSQKSMRNCIGWPPRSSVRWSLNEKKSSTKFDKANQTIEALKFKNNFLDERTKNNFQHLCYHCGATGHIQSNCYKWLVTQQSNSMISLGNHNQFLSSFAPFGDLLKAFMFLSNLNGFNSSPSPLDQGFAKRKGSSKVWKEKCFK